MSTPEEPRPTLDDTIARIDAAVAEHAEKLAAQPECQRCGRQALIGSDLCAYHLQLTSLPLRMVEAEADELRAEPVIRDGNTFTVAKPGVYEVTWNPGGSGEPSVAERALEKPRHLPGPPTATCPGCQADAARPGWLDRVLRRLFT